MRYRNVVTGREVELPVPDWWLDASDGWERVEERPVADESESEA